MSLQIETHTVLICIRPPARFEFVQLLVLYRLRQSAHHDSRPIAIGSWVSRAQAGKISSIMSGATILYVFAALVALSIACYALSPKGDNQTSVLLSHSLVLQPDSPVSRVWRFTSILTLVSMYLMWMLTYIAQLHPLVAPKIPNENYSKSGF